MFNIKGSSIAGSPCGSRCVHSGTATGTSLRIFQTFPAIIIPLVLHIHSSIIRWTDNFYNGLNSNKTF